MLEEAWHAHALLAHAAVSSSHEDPTFADAEYEANGIIIQKTSVTVFRGGKTWGGVSGGTREAELRWRRKRQRNTC